MYDEYYFFLISAREGKNNTIGFVTFSDQDDCKSALEMESPEIGGSRLSLKIAPDKKDFSAKKTGGGGGGVSQEPSSRISKNKARLIIRNLSFKDPVLQLSGKLRQCHRHE